MRLVMIKDGLYEIHDHNNKCCYTIKMRTEKLSAHLDRHFWRLHPSEGHDMRYGVQENDFRSLRAALRSLDVKFSNHPGPLQVLRGLYD